HDPIGDDRALVVGAAAQDDAAAGIAVVFQFLLDIDLFHVMRSFTMPKFSEWLCPFHRLWTNIPADFECLSPASGRRPAGGRRLSSPRAGGGRRNNDWRVQSSRCAPPQRGRA